MTSPCETTAYTASSPSRAFHSRTASTARSCMSRIDSPPSPGNVIADGCDCTTFHSGSLASFFSSPPVQSPYRTSPTRSSTCRSTGSWPASIRSAVSRQRCSGLVTTAASGTPASRAGQRGHLGAAGVVEADALGPAGEHPGAVGGGAPVADEQDGGHAERTLRGHNEPRDRRLRPLPPRRARGVARGLLRRARHRPGPGRQLRLGRAARPDRGRSSTRSPPSSRCTSWRSRTRSRPTSGRRSRSTTTRCSSSSRRCATTRTSQQIELGDVMLFVGDSFVVTVRHGKGRALADVRKRLEAQHGDPRLRPVGRALRDRRQDRRRLHRDRPRGRGGHRGGRAAGLLPRPQQRRRPDLQPQARGDRVPPGGAAPGRADGAGWPAARCRTCTSGCSRSSATSPTTRSGSSEQVEGFDDLLTSVLNANLAQVARAAERGHAPDLGLGGDRGGAHGDRRASTG